MLLSILCLRGIINKKADAFKTADTSQGNLKYWLYYDYYVHIEDETIYNGVSVNKIRIGTEFAWMRKDDITIREEPAKVKKSTNLWIDPTANSRIIDLIQEGEDILVLDIHGEFLFVKHRGNEGYVLKDATDYEEPIIPGANDGERAVELIKQKLGCSYVWAGSGPYDYDCSGLMQWAYNRLDIFMHRTADVQGVNGKLISREDILPGDLITFHTDSGRPKSITHVGIYAGNGIFIHATTNGLHVAEQVYDRYAYPTAYIRRYFEE